MLLKVQGALHNMAYWMFLGELKGIRSRKLYYEAFTFFQEIIVTYININSFILPI